MGSQASELVPDIQSGVSESLRQASETLNRAAERAATPKPAQSKAARTREELLLAAAQVFAEQGIEKASMGDIASKAGYTKGALYANFSSKQDLIRHVARSTDRVTAVEPEDAQELDCATDLPGSPTAPSTNLLSQTGCKKHRRTPTYCLRSSLWRTGFATPNYDRSLQIRYSQAITRSSPRFSDSGRLVPVQHTIPPQSQTLLMSET
ncbi:helix-turn-helix transcriptional regulator [Leucobacter coleopterorum]|uniref:Helix-turn-helix transcriptional regulator n=2 Tax=Leucobacter coleopterorum TaxID=2714933 RepID=A0ABX6JZP2_9MICO|nr:helix-turn-helix transcriptional regulator [Leucobacter coleopterorum]